MNDETREIDKRIRELHDRMKQRTSINYQGTSSHNPSVQYNTFSDNKGHAFMQKRSETPCFQGMEVNAFDPKTPDAFKMGKTLLANAVNLQVQQEPSPGGHVRNLFSPKAQGSNPMEHRRLSSGSSGGRVNTGLGLVGRSPKIAHCGFSG